MTVIRSPIRPVIFSPIRTPTTLYKGGGLPWYPNRLFQSGDILLWYDPSDLTTMFTNTTGTTQVAADGDSVALMLDKGQWGGKSLTQVLAAQPELVTNPSGTILRDGVNPIQNYGTGVTVSAGKLYVLTYTVTQLGGSTTSASWRVGGGAISGITPTNVSAAFSGTRTTFFLSTSTSGSLSLNPDNSTVNAAISDVSVKEIPGYHRTQATGTSMPKYKTGPNPAAAENSPELVSGTLSGYFDGSGPTNGTLYSLAGTVSTEWFPVIEGKSYRLVSTGNRATWRTRNTGGTITLNASVATGGTFVLTMPTGAVEAQVYFSNGAGGSASIKEIPASAPYIHWLLYDGTDDSHATSGINWGTDEVAACVGLYKSSDAAQACFAAFGTNAGTAGVSAEQGLILAPGAAAATTYYARFGGSLTPIQAVATGYAAPHTGVVSARGKIATDLQGISVNRGTEALGSGDMGTGNFGSAMPMHFGRRASTSIPFNGREYQTVIRSRLLSAAELSSLETYVAEKTGVIL